MQTFNALEKRQDIFFARPEWKDTPFRSRPKTMRELLYDIALQVPGLLARTDQFLSSSAQPPRPGSSDSIPNNDRLQELTTAEELLDSFTQVRTELKQWLRTFEDLYYPIPIYWQTNEVFDSTYSVLDIHCIPNHDNPKHLLRFRDGQKAGALICYWGIMLELLMGLIDVQSAVSIIMAPTPAAAMRVVALCQNMDANHFEADATASLMLQSLPYLECCLEGVFVSRLPIRIVHRYYAQHRSQPSE
jgi:hypothetical protein